MTLAEIKHTIDTYLAVDQPPINLAVTEVRGWFRVRQQIGDVHAFSVRRAGNLMVVDVQTTVTGSVHSLSFDETKWLNSPTAPRVNLVPSRKNIAKPKPETPEDAYDRAMRGI